MNYKNDLQKLLDDFYTVKNKSERTKENLLKQRIEAVNILDIEKIKEIDGKLVNFDKD